MDNSATHGPGNEATVNGPGVGPGRARARRWRPSLRQLMLALGLLVIVIGGIIYWRSRAWESTDNAQIDGFVFPITHVGGVGWLNESPWLSDDA